jgi:predicted DNA-binding protein YlxM (UPF0122 family)
MTLEELKEIFIEKGPLDIRIRKWVLKNIKKYIRRRRYPATLAPEENWGEDAYQQLLDYFYSGREVKDKKTGQNKIVNDFNLPEIFDRCASLDTANVLLQNQFHFFFQKNREPGIKDNLVRRIKMICKENQQLNIWDKGVSATYGLKRWTISPVAPWEGSDAELYHVVYASLGEYVSKVYSEHSAYNSPEISSKDLTTFLIDIFSAADKRLTISQILYVLGTELEINEQKYKSLSEDAEENLSLLETIPANVSNPEEELMQKEEDQRNKKKADAFHDFLPDHLRELLDFVLQGEGSLEEFSRQTNRPPSTVYDQMKQIKTQLKNYAKTPYEQRMVLDSLLEKRSPQRGRV